MTSLCYTIWLHRNFFNLLFLNIYVISSVLSSSGGAVLEISAQESFSLPAIIFTLASLKSVHIRFKGESNT